MRPPGEERSQSVEEGVRSQVSEESIKSFSPILQLVRITNSIPFLLGIGYIAETFYFSMIYPKTNLFGHKVSTSDGFSVNFTICIGHYCRGFFNMTIWIAILFGVISVMIK